MKKLLVLIALMSTQVYAAGWEYATLVSSTDITVWAAPTENVQAATTEEVFQKLMCGKLQTYTQMLNCIGGKGWELVSIDNSSGQFASKTFYFKRPKK